VEFALRRVRTLAWIFRIGEYIPNRRSRAPGPARAVCFRDIGDNGGRLVDNCELSGKRAAVIRDRHSDRRSARMLYVRLIVSAYLSAARVTHAQRGAYVKAFGEKDRSVARDCELRVALVKLNARYSQLTCAFKDTFAAAAGRAAPRKLPRLKRASSESRACAIVMP